MKSRPVLVLLALVLAMFAAPAAFAQPTEIRVDRGTAAPLPIAAPAFTGAGPHGVELAESIRHDAPADPATTAADAQQQAPLIIARLKQAVTTVPVTTARGEPGGT